VKAPSRRLCLIAFSIAIIAGGAFLYLLYPPFSEAVNQVTQILVTADIAGLRLFILDFGIWAPIVSIGIMIFQSLASPLPSFVVTLANAWVFGWKAGAFYSWTGGMLGAALCWIIAKAFGRPLVEKMIGRAVLEKTDGFFREHGVHAILIARLLPVMPFDAVSYAAGLTPLSFWSFLSATGVGQMPGTILYSIWGQNLTRSGKALYWGISGFAILLVFAWVVRNRLKKKDQPANRSR